MSRRLANLRKSENRRPDAPALVPNAEIAHESNREMARYDQLGPLARHAIGQAHRILDVAKVVAAFKNSDPRPIHQRAEHPLDLKDPATDRRLADKIDSIVQSDCSRSIAELELRPRRTIRRSRP